MKQQFRQLFFTHIKEIIREPAVIFWGMAFPLLTAWGLGMAFGEKSEVEKNIIVLKPLQNSQIIQWIEKSGKVNDSVYVSDGFSLTIMDESNAIIQLKRGEASLMIAPGNELTFIYDPANSEAETAKLQFMETLSNGQNKYITQKITVPGNRYIDFLLPGLMGMNIMMSTMWGISYGMIEKRKLKLLRRMIATPMNRSYFLWSLILARFLINVAEMLLLFIFATLLFDFKLQGSVLNIALVFISSNISFAGLAVILSSRTSNTEVGNGLINAIVTPMTVVSGVFFSYHNFPEFAESIIKWLPLTMSIDALRSVFNEGIALSELWLPLTLLNLSGILFFIVGLKIFKWY
jgi:ABC-type multidrug transport system permease subunit